MPTISVIIPTHNRPELLKRAIASVCAQTYSDWELIIVDDGSQTSVQNVVDAFHDQRIRFIRHEIQKGGGAARNSGIRNANGDFIAFLDDDDEWLPEKLTVQMTQFAETSDDVGFCFSSVINVHDDYQKTSMVPNGVGDYFNLALEYFNGFLSVTLVIKKSVFEKIGMFDESLPSHQETDLVLRMAKAFKGLGINQPMVLVNMHSGYERTGGSLKRRIAGREAILKKYHEDFKKRPDAFASQYFGLGLFYRGIGSYKKAGRCYWTAFAIDKKLLYLMHYVSMIGNGITYRIIKPWLKK